MDILVASIADRPDLGPLLDDLPEESWPRFMYHDPLATLIYDHATTRWASYCLIAVNPEMPKEPLAKAYSIPFTGALDALPANGWDGVMLQVANDELAGARGNLLCGLEITVRPDLRGTGLARTMLTAMLRNARKLGYADAVGPLRPTRKHEHPDLPLAEYVGLTRDDGLPVDPWLRAHVRGGARVVSLAPRSMTITGSLAQWREWTGLPFDRTGPVRVPGALVPVHCDLEADLAVYVEPNVWVHHRLDENHPLLA